MVEKTNNEVGEISCNDVLLKEKHVCQKMDEIVFVFWI